MPDRALGCPSDNGKRPRRRPGDDRQNPLIYLGIPPIRQSFQGPHSALTRQRSQVRTRSAHRKDPKAKGFCGFEDPVEIHIIGPRPHETPSRARRERPRRPDGGPLARESPGQRVTGTPVRSAARRLNPAWRSLRVRVDGPWFYRASQRSIFAMVRAMGDAAYGLCSTKRARCCD